VKTIVVGTDGSDSSLSAVREAATMAVALGATLNVACVARQAIDFSAAAMAPMPAMFDTSADSDADVAVSRAATVAEELGATVERHVVHGEPSAALIELCEKLDADLLVVGSRGMTGAARFLLGSVPNRCAHHAPCSVLIVRTS
jgi:nucleotide-binding universal stress UspA family protein